MDKNRMNDDEKITAHVHRLPNVAKQEIHKQYGLWIMVGSSSGVSSTDSYRKCAPRYFEFYAISHMYSGHGRLWLEPDFEQEVNAGECILITPGTLNRYGGVGECYIEDTINFNGPVADMLMRAGIISNGVFPLGGIRRLLPIIELMRDPAVNSQIRANIELQRLLIDIHLEKCSSSQEEYPLLEQLLDHLKENPQKWWTVSEMAEMCNLSCDQLRRVFFQRTGVNPKLYLDRLKLNKAAELLTGSKSSIAEIAEQFGYVDQYHFSRRFKALLGMSPKRYRETVLRQSK